MSIVTYEIDKEGMLHKVLCRSKNGKEELISIQLNIPIYKEMHLIEKTGICYICKNVTNSIVCNPCQKRMNGFSSFYRAILNYHKIGYRNPTCDPLTKKKISERNLEKYGATSHMKLDSYKKMFSDINSENYNERMEKSKKTNLERYGVEHYSKTEDFKEKYQNTSIEKYGVKHVLQSKEVRKKQKETLLERYGVDAPSRIEESKEKTKRTNFERYGTTCSVQNIHIKEGITKQNIERYGVEHSWQRSDVIEKATETREIRKYGKRLINFKEEWRKVYFDHGIAACIEKFPNIGVQTGMNTFLKDDERTFFEGRSNPERSARYLFETLLGFSFQHSVRSIVPGNNRLEIDFLNRENKISVEFNGVYYHKDTTKKDLCKAELMRSDGWKHLVLNEFDDVGSIIQKILLKKEKIYARNTYVCSNIKNDEEKNFLQKWHLQGHVNSTIKFGLRKKDTNELVSIMTFSRARFRKSVDFELLRYAYNHDIIGGAEKLFKNAIKSEILKGKSIVSYSDNRFFDGSVYKKLGFDFVKNTNPNYHWVKGSVILTRYQTMKHKLEKLLGANSYNENLTEKENMEKNGYIQVFDLGNKMWEFNSS
jgi:very-short-patch-repair endonuclease